MCITEHVKCSSVLTAKTTVTPHLNTSNPPPVATAQVPIPQKNAKGNLQLSVPPAVVATKVTIENVPDIPRKNWKKIDCDAFSKAVAKYIEDSPVLSPSLTTGFDNSTTGLDLQIQSLANALSDAINESAPDSKICARSKAGFNEECKEAQMRARRLKKAWKANPCKETWEEFRVACNYKGMLIKKALRQAYRSKVAEACASEKGMCQFSRWSQNKTVHRLPFQQLKAKQTPSKKPKNLLQSFFSCLQTPPSKIWPTTHIPSQLKHTPASPNMKSK